MKKIIKGYKGFNKELKCGDFQYEIEKIFEEKKAPSCCNNGFHFCEYPLDVFKYYSPANNRFCEVEALGEIDRDEDDTKISTNKIKIGVEINLAKITEASIHFIYEHAKKTNCKGVNLKLDSSVASNTGKNGISSSLGMESKAKGKKGTWLVLAEWVQDNDYNWGVKEVKTAKVDGKKIKEDTLYQLINGKFVEIESNKEC